MSEQEKRTIPLAEMWAWITFGIAAAVYSIAFIVLLNLGYGDDGAAASAWMTFAGMIAGLVLVPAIILTGLRQLIPLLRSTN